MKKDELIQKAREAIRECFDEVPFIQIKQINEKRTNAESSPDFVLRLKTPPYGEKTIVVEIQSSGQPRLARIIINKISSATDYPDSYGVFVAPFISDNTSILLREHGMGYVDLAGNCFISFHGVHIHKKGKANPFLTKRRLGSLYEAKASRVIRVLLSDPRRPWQLKTLAEEAQISLGHAHNVKQELADREWIKAEPNGIRLLEPAALLKDWSEHYNYLQNKSHHFYSLCSLSELEHNMADACRELGIRYALSAFSGAARVAPFVRYHRITAYVDGHVAALSRLLELKQVTSGENVTLLIPYDFGVFYHSREIDAVRIASPIQIYLDLIASPGRGEEAAAFLYEKEIIPGW